MKGESSGLQEMIRILRLAFDHAVYHRDSQRRVVMMPSGFRIRFVFPVVHGFLLCGVTILDPYHVEHQNPLRTGLAQLKHPAPN
jgi:hypothetical protein